MADIRAKTQSSDKTNPPECVGDDTVVSELLQHKAAKPKGEKAKKENCISKKTWT